jgi:hypothetical protein
VSRHHPPRRAQYTRRSFTLTLFARALDDSDGESGQSRIIEPRLDTFDGPAAEGGDSVAPLDAAIASGVVGLGQEDAELHRTLQSVQSVRGDAEGTRSEAGGSLKRKTHGPWGFSWKRPPTW